MASEATKMTVRGNMYNDTRDIEVDYFKFKVKFGLRGHQIGYSRQYAHRFQGNGNHRASHAYFS